ncbi:E3 ubiquitin-protein ligase RNF165-like [Neltuma alba]|uniref:E3 ubiquitin-protein ligase RNF165-like n=1 Tax=Neltuma alba TaxID=207710 RepID=UPI0010A4FA10|nr:E3 ubiquitin-protein ligase RNF165-like [Prosopis alba]
MESHRVEDIRIYECRLHKWDPAIQCDFLDGHPESPPPEEEYFQFRVVLKERYYNISNMHHDRTADTNTTEYDFFSIPYASRKEATDYMISILNIPEANRKSMAQQILDYMDFVPDLDNSYNLFVMMLVNVDIFYHDCDKAMERGAKEDQGCRLKGVKIQEEEVGECGICWENFRIDTVQMPCSHLFHGNCILSWLLRKNNCPMCRFQMPSIGTDS